jgi:protein-disulfide isomerase
LAALASRLGLDVAELRQALDQGTYSAKVESDFAGGIRSGVNGTPCFFVNGERHNGAYDAMSLSAAIEAARNEVASNVVRIPVA